MVDTSQPSPGHGEKLPAFLLTALTGCAAALRFVNADVLSREVGLDPYLAAQMADRVRRQLVAERESFVFETVFSDPVGDKLKFLKEAAEAGYTVVLCFIGISGPVTRLLY